MNQCVTVIAASGLAGFVADIREFLAAIRLTHPEALWLLLLLPVLGLINRWAARKRRRNIARIGRPAAVAGQLTHPAACWRWLGLAYPLAWLLLILGLTGPRWGKSEETGVAVGRDIVIVIDLSRSMRADDVSVPAPGWQNTDARERFDPVRWRSARQGALNLVDGISRRGGHRVAVLVFAAHPKVLCPLTSDYDHVRSVIEEIDGQHPPPECRPSPNENISGTRIGAALGAAVTIHDKRFPGYQEIFLLSDGDDPKDDNEWQEGSRLARSLDIPIYTVGIGNPDEPRQLLLGTDLVATRLQEKLLKQIAAETRGEYIAARTNPPQLGEFFRTQLEPLPGREVSDEFLPLPAERYPWFLALALAFFLIGWLRGR